MNFTAKKITTMAMFAAISIVLVTLIHFPIFPMAPYLEYDPADIPIFITTFLFGPLSGLVLTFIVCVIQGITVSFNSGPIGIAMHFVATGSFVLVAGLIYKYKSNAKGLIIGSICGVLVMTMMMVLWNLILTPIYTGFPRQAILDIMWPAIIPFNLIKATSNAIMAAAVFKILEKRGIFQKLFHKSVF